MIWNFKIYMYKDRILKALKKDTPMYFLTIRKRALKHYSPRKYF